MKLEKILDKLGSLEKNSFIKIIDNIIVNDIKNTKSIDKLITDTDKSGLKNLDNVVVSRIFDLVKNEFSETIRTEFLNTSSQLDILIDIMIRDGNCIMKVDWFSHLYDLELKKINKKIKALESNISNLKSELSNERKRDYRIYKSCVHTSLYNDLDNNRDAKITDDELSILITLSQELGLSLDEVKLINYMILKTNRLDIDTIISYLKNIGVIFFSKKTNTIYVADEMVRLLRGIRKKEIADKFLRRILRTLKDSQINQICRIHNIDRKLSTDQKIKTIINEGLSARKILLQDIHKSDTNVSEKKLFLNEIWSCNLGNSHPLKGSTSEDKINNIFSYFDSIEKDEKVGISVDGYEKLLIDLSEALTGLNKHVRDEFELQDEHVLKSTLLLDYNIKPRDILDIIRIENLDKFCKEKEVKTRGNKIDNILDAYKDHQNLYLENYTNIGFRDMNLLKENGIRLNEADIGLKFEELTKLIFARLGFNVDEKLKNKLNTSKDKIDILLNLDSDGLILIECKTKKESGYNKFSSVSRQLRSYTDLVKNNDYKVIKTLLIAPDFSDDFINDTELEYNLNLSLIKSSSLLRILESFKNSKKHKRFPYKLLLRDVLIDEDRIIKSIGRWF